MWADVDRFGKDFCQSCQDVDGKYAELVYRFVVILEDEGGELAVIIADEEAVRRFLFFGSSWSTSRVQGCCSPRRPAPFVPSEHHCLDVPAHLGCA